MIINSIKNKRIILKDPIFTMMKINRKNKNKNDKDNKNR
jgi:hypothetical protein